MSRDVAIIGVGCVLPQGTGDAALDRVLAGHCAAELWAANPRYVVGRVPDGIVRERPGEDRAVAMALAAADGAFRDAGLLGIVERAGRAAGGAAQAGQGIAPERIASVFSVSKGAVQQLVALARAATSKGRSETVPCALFAADPATAARAMACRYDLRGPVYAPATACASGGHALAAARDLILEGRADCVVCGAADASLHEIILASYARLGLLAPVVEDLRLTCRPFARDRCGFYVGEGAAAFVVTSVATARLHGLCVRATLLGSAEGSLASDLIGVPEDGNEVARLIKMALDDAGLSPGDVDLVNVHGTGTRDGDVNEARAVGRVFGACRARPALMATKPLHGHLLGAASAAESAVLIRAVETGIVPALAPGEWDAQCGLGGPGSAGSGAQFDAAIKVAVGFGGQVSVNVFGRHGR